MTARWVSPEAEIGEGCRFGESVRVYAGVQLGSGSSVGDFCVLGHPTREPRDSEPLSIGAGALIRSHAVLYRGSTLGPDLETGHHVVIREGTTAGANLRVGNYSDIEGECRIGDYTRLHGYVHVGRGSSIGDFVWIFSQATLMNDPLPPSRLTRPVVVGDGVVIGVGALIMPGASLMTGAFVAAGTKVSGPVRAGAVVEGPETREVTHVALLADLAEGLRHPWMNHFADAYPAEAQERIERLRRAILESRRMFLAGVMP